MPFRILFTNLTLASRSGTETFVRDLAFAVARRGHTVCVYSPRLGAIAAEIAAGGITVVDDPSRIDRPDLIHGHHHPETMTALASHPGTPALFVCHDAEAWHDAPPRFPRIFRYVAVDEACRDRLVTAAIPADRIDVIANFVDLARFRPRAPLPPRPARALVFNNVAAEENCLPVMREACRRHGISLDVVGAAAGAVSAEPERVIGKYDVVFARGRSAIEAMAVGAAVVVSGTKAFGGFVTGKSFDRLRALNFGRRCLVRPLAVDDLDDEIARYDPADAAAVSERIRRDAGVETAVERWIALYGEVIDDAASSIAADPLTESRAVAAYLRAWEDQWSGLHAWLADRERAQRALDRRLLDHQRLAEEHAELLRAHHRLRVELDDHYRSATIRLRNTIVGMPLVGRLVRALARRAAER